MRPPDPHRCRLDKTMATQLDYEPGTVMVLGLSQARKRKRQFDAVITLEDPACRPASRLRFHRHPSPAHLVLAFEDVDDDSLGIRVATPEQVAEALEFATRYTEAALLVHCFHGVGRSAAIALAIIADRLGAGQEPAAISKLLTIQPDATPNLVVVGHADQILGRQGGLIAAVERWEVNSPGLNEKREARRTFALANPGLYARLQRASAS